MYRGGRVIDGIMGYGCFTSRCKGAELFRTSSTLDGGGEEEEGRGKEEGRRKRGRGKEEERRKEGREEEEKRGEEERRRRESSKKASNEQLAAAEQQQQQQEWKQEAGSSDDRTHSGEVGEIVVGKKKRLGEWSHRTAVLQRQGRAKGRRQEAAATQHPSCSSGSKSG